jgi:hypothetical protein
MHALVTPAEVQDNQPMLDLLWRVRFRWRLRPRQVTGDTKYGTIVNIVAVEEQGIRAYVPLANWENKTGYLGSNRFTYDPQRDVYFCPQGQLLHRRTNEYKSRKVEYGARAEDCNTCSLKAQCIPSDHGRIVYRRRGNGLCCQTAIPKKTRLPRKERAASGTVRVTGKCNSVSPATTR